MRKTTLGVLAIATIACRPPLGEPDYPDITLDTGTIDDGGLPGDDPWEEGELRLKIGGAYEGGFSDELVIDNDAINFYIYENSFFVEESDDNVEGLFSQRFTVQNEGAGFWGGGIHFDGRPPVDMSQWTTFHIALKSSDPEMSSFQLGIVAGEVEGRWNLADYGFAADGEWHVLNMPLADLTPAIDASQVTVGTLFISATATNDTSILLDDGYFTAAPTE